MALNVADLIKPDSYLPTVYDINYPKLYENGIRYAVFDVDCTILPFDDIKVTNDNVTLFNSLKLLGLKTGLCSSGTKKRVEPVADILGVKYIANAPKPFVGFGDI